MILFKLPRAYMNFYGLLQTFMDFYKLPRTSTVASCKTEWKTKINSPLLLMILFKLPPTSTKFYGLPRTSMDFYKPPWTSTNFYGLLYQTYRTPTCGSTPEKICFYRILNNSPCIRLNVNECKFN